MHVEYTRADADRFYNSVDTTGNCWLWTAYVSPAGYGRFSVTRNGKSIQRSAHRAAWEMLHGPLDDEWVLDHLCRVRHCVRDTHLEPVSNRTNILRGVGASALNARKTHCKHGHQDWFINANGVRECATCRRAARRRRKRG